MTTHLEYLKEYLTSCQLLYNSTTLLKSQRLLSPINSIGTHPLIHNGSVQLSQRVFIYPLTIGDVQFGSSPFTPHTHSHARERGHTYYDINICMNCCRQYKAVPDMLSYYSLTVIRSDQRYTNSK